MEGKACGMDLNSFGARSAYRIVRDAFDICESGVRCLRSGLAHTRFKIAKSKIALLL